MDPHFQKHSYNKGYDDCFWDFVFFAGFIFFLKIIFNFFGLV